MAIDDEVTRRAEFVVARARFQERSSPEQGKPLPHEISSETIALAVEHALAHIRIGRGIAAQTDSESTIVWREGGPARNSREIEARQIRKREAVVSWRCAEVMHIPQRRSNSWRHQIRKCLGQPRSQCEHIGRGTKRRRRSRRLDVLKMTAIAISERRVSQHNLSTGL